MTSTAPKGTVGARQIAKRFTPKPINLKSVSVVGLFAEAQELLQQAYDAALAQDAPGWVVDLVDEQHDMLRSGADEISPWEDGL